jgi:hypothetical protein
MVLQMAVDPGEKSLYVRFTVSETVKLFGLSRQREGFDVVLDSVESRDAPECF